MERGAQALAQDLDRVGDRNFKMRPWIRHNARNTTRTMPAGAEDADRPPPRTLTAAATTTTTTSTAAAKPMPAIAPRRPRWARGPRAGAACVSPMRSNSAPSSSRNRRLLIRTAHLLPDRAPARPPASATRATPAPWRPAQRRQAGGPPPRKGDPPPLAAAAPRAAHRSNAQARPPKDCVAPQAQPAPQSAQHRPHAAAERGFPTAQRRHAQPAPAGSTAAAADGRP